MDLSGLTVIEQSEMTINALSTRNNARIQKIQPPIASRPAIPLHHPTDLAPHELAHLPLRNFLRHRHCRLHHFHKTANRSPFRRLNSGTDLQSTCKRKFVCGEFPRPSQIHPRGRFFNSQLTSTHNHFANQQPKRLFPRLLPDRRALCLSHKPRFKLQTHHRLRPETYTLFRHLTLHRKIARKICCRTSKKTRPHHPRHRTGWPHCLNFPMSIIRHAVPGRRQDFEPVQKSPLITAFHQPKNRPHLRSQNITGERSTHANSPLHSRSQNHPHLTQKQTRNPQKTKGRRENFIKISGKIRHETSVAPHQSPNRRLPRTRTPKAQTLHYLFSEAIKIFLPPIS